MSDKTKVKYISDYDINDSDILVKKPFKLNKENQRRFVRVEISAPVSLKNLKNDIDNISHDVNYDIEGTIFNISANGVLIEIKENVAIKDLMLIKFTIQDIESIDSVLGMVKRIDKEDDYNLIGIEFLSPKSMQDRFSQVEIDLLEENISNFNDKIYETLENYLYKNDKEV